MTGRSAAASRSIALVIAVVVCLFAGTAFGSTAGKWSQGSNVDDQLRRAGITEQPELIKNWDTNVSFGGPIKRDRLWFFTVGRAWGKEAFNSSNENIWDNKNAGIWGMNYQPDRSQEPLTLINWTRNANARITLQASTKNKFNIFWDEGFTCQDPCDGAVASWAPR